MYGGTLIYMCALSMERAPSHCCGVYNFEVAFIFWGNLYKAGRDGVILNPHLLTLKVILKFNLPYKRPAT